MLNIQSNLLISANKNRSVNEGKGLRFKPGQRLREIINNNNFNHMARENLVKMKCEVCKNINYFTKRNKKKLKEKLAMKKHCKKCKKHTAHKEMK